MSYHIYTTDGIILKRTTFGEANLLLYVITEDFGLIVASAQAARLSSSKLRTALQEFSLCSISCVKGKGGWKITNAVEKENFFYTCPKFSHKVLYQMVSILLKMIPGESPQPEIFQTIRTGLNHLRSLSQKHLSDFEILLVLRLMYDLGYVVRSEDLRVFLENREDWQPTIFEKVSQKKKEIISVINKALKESHL